MGLPPLKRVDNGVAIDPQGRYWVRIKLGRRSVRELRNGLEDAKQRRDALRVDYRRSKAKPGSRFYVNPGKMKLSELIQLMNKRQEDLVTKSTLKRYGTSDKALLRLLGQAVQIGDVTNREVEDFRMARRREVEPATVNRDLTRLRALLSEAVRRDLLAKVPFEYRRQKLREPEGRIRVLSEQEEDELLFAADPELSIMLEFSLLTGFRLSEQLQLTWNNVHKARIHIPGSKTKTHRRRVVPITSKIQDLLDEQAGRHRKWVFPNKTGSNHWETQNFYRDLWNPARHRAGVQDLRWHDLRHTFCSRLIAKGANVVAVKELAGHQSIDVTMRYVHLAPDHLRGTMDLL
jgi:integrase